MKIKATNGKPQYKAGVYKSKVEDSRYYKNEKGELQEDTKGNYAIDFDFRTEKGQLIQKRFWLSPNQMYILRKFLKAIEVDNSEGAIPASETHGKEFWMVVKETVIYEGEEEVSRESTISDYINIKEDRPSSKDLLTEIKEEAAEEPEELEEDDF